MKYILFGFTCVVLVLGFVLGSSYYKGQQAEKYGFLAQKRMVSALEFQQFQNEALEIKQELLEKMQKYNAVRHDESINENKKEAIRDEIFEGDHAWPFI
jgi:hypothetical protein